MKKAQTTILSLIIVILCAVIFFAAYRYTSKKEGVQSVGGDVKNSSYVIDGKVFTLENGFAAESASPELSFAQSVQILGEPVYGDLNKDGLAEDAAVILVSNPGGSGLFYYAVLAMKIGGVYKTTNALLLGDRIAIRSVEIREGRALVSYAERKSGDPMTVEPTMAKSLLVHYDAATGEIGELAQGFEGEANPDMMTLGMKKWEWVKTQMNNDTIISPKKQGLFTITFNTNNTVYIGTDCNNAAGEYAVSAKKLTFDKMISTEMYCEGSQEQQFAKAIQEVTSYFFTSKGELILEMKNDSGSIILR